MSAAIMISRAITNHTREICNTREEHLDALVDKIVDYVVSNHDVPYLISVVCNVTMAAVKREPERAMELMPYTIKQIRETVSFAVRECHRKHSITHVH